jgi:hypothetical protein
MEIDKESHSSLSSSQIDSQSGDEDLVSLLEQSVQEALSSQGPKYTRKGANSWIKNEISYFENEHVLPIRLQNLQEALMSISPGSVEPERSFSSSGFILSNLRAAMDDKVLDSLVFLRAHAKSMDN